MPLPAGTRPGRYEVILLAWLVFVPACGGGSTSTPTPPTTPTTPTTPVPSSPDGCRFPRMFSGVGLGFPRETARVPSTGQLRYKVLFADFPGGVATRSPESVFAMVSPASEAYFQSVSYGRMTLVYQPEFRWLRMSKTAGEYTFTTFEGHRSYIQEAVNLAGSSVDYSQADALLVLADPNTAGLSVPGPALVANAGTGITAGGRIFSNGATSGRDLSNWGALWANHEMGHNLGLPDLYASSAPGNRYVGMYSLMGLISGPARELFGWERWNLDWLDDGQVTCVMASGTTDVSLTALSATGGIKMAVVPLSSTSGIVVESRRTGAYDSGFTPGALVYVVDTSIRTIQGPIRVLPLNDSDQSKGSAPLTAGRSLTHGGVTISVVSAGASDDVVRVVRTP